jgi:hypothetical protein
MIHNNIAYGEMNPNPLSAADLTKDQRELLKARFRQFLVKSRAESAPFGWQNPEDFIESIYRKTDQPPELYRLTFHKEQLKRHGYCEKSLLVRPYDPLNGTRRKPKKLLTISHDMVNLCLVSAHIATLLLTEQAETNELSNRAVRMALNK